MLNSSKIEIQRRHVEELAALRERHRAELAAWRAAKAQEKKERKKKADVALWKKNDFFRAISEAYKTENRRQIYALAQNFRRRHGITTAAEVVAFKAKLETEKAARRAEKENHRKQLNQKKELFEAIASAYKTQNRRQIYALAQNFRRRHGITTAAEVVAFKDKLETEKAARQAEKEKKAADRAQKKEQARLKREQARLKKEEKRREKEKKEKKNKEKKEDLRKAGYICLGDVFELFNKCRRETHRATISKRGTLYNYMKRFRVRWAALDEKEKFYFKHDVIVMATAQDKRGPDAAWLKSKSFFPIATPLDLDSGEYCTRGAFARMAGISKSTVLYHSNHADFKMMTHPSSGEALLHIPTAAAFFVAYSSQKGKKESP